ncbi:hypothetical protein ACHAXR_006805 [Thalassiosira sp. AJA248-18]
MEENRRRIRGINGHKRQLHRLTSASSSQASSASRRNYSVIRGLPPLLLMFIAVLSVVAMVMMKVACDIHKDDMHENNNGGGATGAMLKNFVEGTKDKNTTGYVSSNDASSQKERIDNQHKRQPPPPDIDALIDRSHRIEIPDQNRTLAFVHIGKSGGSTISLLLRNGCMSAVDGTPCESDRWLKVPGQVQETPASKRIQFYLHVPHVESGRIAEYYRRVSSVVVVARDPLERFVSAFLSRHPANMDAMRLRNVRIRKKAEMDGVEPPIWAKPTWGSGRPMEDQIHRVAFRGCYPSIEHFAMCADPTRHYPFIKSTFETKIIWSERGKHEMDITLKCREICQEIVSGENDFIQHLQFNYEAFLKYLPPKTEVFVIRTKSLWRDWIDLNRLLGGTSVDLVVPDEGSKAEAVNARGRLPVRNNLSDRGRTTMCKHLANEIRIYIDLLNRAVNLSDDDIRSALELCSKNCPSVLHWLVHKAKKAS